MGDASFRHLLGAKTARKVAPMKKNRIQGISAAVASLALAGTCFAAPAFAATDSASVFGSGNSSEAVAAEPAATEEAPADIDPEFSVDADLDYADAIMEALGISDADLEKILSGDLSIVTDLLGDEADADTLAAIDEAEQSLADANISAQDLKDAVNSFANEAYGMLAETFGQVKDYLEQNDMVYEDAVLYSGESALASDPASQQVSLGGASFLAPADYDVEELTSEDIATVLEDDTAADAVSGAYVVSNADGSAGIIAAEISSDSVEGAGADIAQLMAENSRIVYINGDDFAFSAGIASLDDGTPVFDLGFLSDGSADIQTCLYELVVMPSDDGGLVALVAITDESASLEDCATLADILTSLTGTGAAQTL